MLREEVLYKNFKISKEVLPFIKHMESVQESQEKLSDLTKNWDSLSLLSQLGDAGVNMSKIKNNFSSLSSELIDYLAMEILKKSVKEMHSKAQVAVDIVVRNLFERTADIGFLATDEKIRNFLINNSSKYSKHYEQDFMEIRERFLEYVDKYSVYFDIVLMNASGQILANIDEQNSVSKSKDSVITKVLNTSEEFVETYKYHDFLPSHEKSLVYSFKVTKNNNPNSEVLGVLSLCFKFEDEMKGVFSNLKNERTKECLTLLDKNGVVIATSDNYHIPIGATLEKVLHEDYQIVSFGGRDYMSKSCKTNGYQEFYGLGWYGHVMVPLEYAFCDINSQNFEITQELLLSILQNSQQFTRELKNIPIQASEIQHNLSRAIWNGNVKQSNSNNNNKQFSRALLQEIRNTGEKTKGTIGASMASLTKTMVLGDNKFLADLILDIMDRNLYERANDCRWWALTPDFREILENKTLSDSDKKKMSEILAYINDLYTVYTNLFVYDSNGVVLAVSKASQNHLVGVTLSGEWIANTLELTDSSKYCVSEFESTKLYNSQHTYIYNASITSIENNNKVLGGIGIVFDSSQQFKAMIEESLPKQNGQNSDTLFAVITTQEQTIISSNNESYVTGEFFEIDKKFYKLKKGESLSEIIEYNGNYYALGVQCSKGYREYKSDKDDYINNVYCFVFSYISDIEETKVQGNNNYVLDKEIAIDVKENSVDVASFKIGSQWLGFYASDIVEAIPIDELKSAIILDNNHHYKGNVMYGDKMVYVVDIQYFINEDILEDYEEIVLIKFGSRDSMIGILVTSLGDIPEIEKSKIKTLDSYMVGNGTLVASMVFPDQDEKSADILSILSSERIYGELIRPQQSHMKVLK
jgi:chemotaxis signal transduction protein